MADLIHVVDEKFNEYLRKIYTEVLEKVGEDKLILNLEELLGIKLNEDNLKSLKR